MESLKDLENFPIPPTGVFSKLNPSFLKVLNQQQKIYYLERGEVLYSEGTQLDGLYFVHSGLIKHFKTSPEGQQYIFTLSRENNFLELEAFLGNKSTFTTAKVLRSSILHFWSSPTFSEIVRKDPNFSQALLKNLSLKIRRSNIERGELAMGDVRERLAHLLTFLAQEYGEQDQATIRINLDISISEMAEMIGTVPETASRHLKEFRQESLIKNRRSNIQILDLKSLQAVNRLS